MGKRNVVAGGKRFRLLWLWIMVVALGALLGACSSEEAYVEEKVPEDEVALSEDAGEPENPTKEKGVADQPKEEKEVAPEPAEQSVQEEVVRMMFEDNYNGIAIVDFDKENKMYTIFPTDPGVALELSQMLSGELSLDTWNELSGVTVEASEVLTEALGSGYSIAILNPLDETKTLLLVADGEVLYDAFNE